jgi:hypothetical protein
MLIIYESEGKLLIMIRICEDSFLNISHILVIHEIFIKFHNKRVDFFTLIHYFRKRLQRVLPFIIFRYNMQSVNKICKDYNL